MTDDPIQPIVVLMLENQSFDRMVGLTPGVDCIDPEALRMPVLFPSQRIRFR